MVRLGYLTRIPIFVISCNTAFNVYAEDSALQLAANVSVEEMIVVGQKEAPITIEPRGLAVSLGEEQFASTNAINLEDLMKYAPNFFVRKRYIGDANGVPGFRGTHSSQSARSLVLVDGFVISNYLGNSFGFPPKWGIVGPGEVQQFDIVYGPYSARYPGNSMGGIVSISTRPPEKNEAFVTLQGFVQPYQQYSTEDTYKGYTFEGGFAMKQDDGPVSVRASYRHFENEGQPMSWSQLTPSTKINGDEVKGAVEDKYLVPTIPNTTPAPIFAAASTDDNTQDQLRLRGDLTFDNWSMHGLLVYWTTESDATNPNTYLRDTNDRPVYRGTVKVNGKYWDTNALNLSLTERTEILAGLGLKGKVANWDLSLNLSHFWLAKAKTFTSNGYDNGVNNGAGTFTDVDPSGWWTFDTKASQEFGKHEITLGLTANLYETDSITYNTTQWRYASNQRYSIETGGKSSLHGVFAEDELHLNDNFSVTAGVRAEKWRAFDGAIHQITAKAPQEYDDREETKTNFSLSSQWAFAENWQAQLSLATATRFPTVGELFQGKFDSTGVFDPYSFDPNLKPESSKDANFILRHQFENARITASIFYQDVSDYIFSFEHYKIDPITRAVTSATTTSFVNVDRVRQTGAELILELSDTWIRGLSVDFNMAYIDDKILKNRLLPVSEGNQFPRIPYWRINSQARYEFAQDWRLSGGVRYASRPNTNLEGTQRGDTFGYASEQLIADARIAWQVNQQTELSFGVDNINNDKAWAYHPFSQRTYLLEAKWKN
ncbi:MAG: TonB-dependent receptor [Gammaproteobacteria bacterium]|nr:MAG: TonB-dependent receptor [Gammaproteobacteria bacterium]